MSGFITSSNLNSKTILPALPIICYKYNNITIRPAESFEIKLPNNIKIYIDKKTVQAITC